jgi:hypothetical protein
MERLRKHVCPSNCIFRSVSNSCRICTKCVKLRFNGEVVFVCPFACFISETTSRISMKFGTNRSCEANLILFPALYIGLKSNFYQFLKKGSSVKNRYIIQNADFLNIRNLYLKYFSIGCNVYIVISKKK